MTSLPVGTKLQNGHFTIGKILGQGGFGITYCGSDTRLNRVVAIKEFFPVGCTRVGLDVHSHGLFDVASYSNARAQFLQEAQSLAQFRHAGIVHVYTFCEENNTAYLVMEFLRGQTLSQLVESRGALPEKEAVEIIEKVCEAVEELHTHKTLHRDIKPDNVILCDDGRVVLIDFGLTKKVEETLGSSTRQLTATTRFGSDGFAPPEQYLKSGIMGTYSDVYALGATLYFLLTGEVPPSAMERLAGEELTPPENLKQVGQNVNDAVMRAMGLKGDLRLQQASNFTSGLKRLARATVAAVAAVIPTPVMLQTGASKSLSVVTGVNHSVSLRNTHTVLCPICKSRNFFPDSVNLQSHICCWSCEGLFVPALTTTLVRSSTYRASSHTYFPAVEGQSSTAPFGVQAATAALSCIHCCQVNYVRSTNGTHAGRLRCWSCLKEFKAEK